MALRPGTFLAGAACVIALAGSMAGGGLAASAATSPWSLQQVPPVDTSTPNAQFRDVSCPTGTACIAVGEYVGTDGIQRTLSEVWDGSSWHIVRPPSPANTEASSLGAVSCVSATACEAIGQSHRTSAAGGQIFAESWNGKSWRMVPIQHPGGTVFLPALSCATAGSCFLVGSRTISKHLDQAVTERWNGRAWSLVAPRRPRPLTQLSGVSCPVPGDCYAAGWSSGGRLASSHPLIEHWNGHRWSTRAVPEPAGPGALNAVSCPAAASCTAVGTAGHGSTRMLVEDLSKGTWAETLPAAPPQAAKGTAGMYAVSCSAPRVCTALLSYINPGEELTWAIAGRAATGGFKVTVPATDVATDTAAGVSCRPAGCTVAGGLDTNDGQGDSTNTGTTFAWRGTGSHFVPQVTPNPTGTAGGSLTSVSCVKSGFCAAAVATTGADTVNPGDPSVLVRLTAHGRWTAPPNAGSGFLTSISCTSGTFCLALGSPSGAERWDGSSWSEAPAPDLFDPNAGGLETVTCLSANSCVAVGSTKQGLKSQALAAAWNGSTWRTLSPAKPAGSRTSRLAGVSCTSGTHCVAAGYYLPAGSSSYRALVETWNGGTWTIASPRMRVSNDFPDHVSVSCATASACMVTWGTFGEDLARWWNGSTWTAPAFAGPKPRSQERSILGVACTSAKSCTAAGSYDYTTGSGPLTQSWNGTKWSVSGAPNPAVGIGEFNAISCTSATACTAVGSIARIENVPLAEARG